MSSHILRQHMPRPLFFIIRTVLRQALPTLCLGLLFVCTASPASAASLYDFATRWGKTTVSSWPPAGGAPTAPGTNATRSIPPSADEAPKPTEALAPATSAVEAPHNATTLPDAESLRRTAPAEPLAAPPAQSGAQAPSRNEPAHMPEGPSPGTNTPQTPPPGSAPAQPAPGALPDDMPSSPLGNAPLHTAPATETPPSK